MIRRKGNTPIEKGHAKRIEDGKLVKELPLVNHGGKLLPLFSVIHPSECLICGSKLHKNKNHDRYILSRYGILEIPVIYWECSSEECNAHYTDTIVGVDGPRNYSNGYLDIQLHTRYIGKSSFHNNRRVAEIYTAEPEYSGRAACPTTLWRYEQEMGKIALERVRDTDVPFTGTLHCDGYWIKTGWKKFIERKLGRELTNKEWKRLRYKIIYVIATEDKVILDFIITDTQPSYLSLIPLFKNVKGRLGEESITRVVSDEDSAIIDAVSLVLPNATHAFCVFHQLKNLTEIYTKLFKDLEKMPYWDKELYELGKKLIMAKNCIEASALLKKSNEIIREPHSEASDNAIRYLRKVHRNNTKFLMKGFEPDTNNVMEQLFSFINDFVFMMKSLKRTWSLKNWTANMSNIWNHRPFNTGPNRGLTPLQITGVVKPG